MKDKVITPVVCEVTLLEADGTFVECIPLDLVTVVDVPYVIGGVHTRVGEI